MRFLPFACVGLMAAFVGCATMPQQNPTLDDAHVAVRKLAEEPNATQIASKQLQDARDALARADSASASHQSVEEVTHLAYLARRLAELGEATLAEARARAQVAQGEANRNRVLLEAREREVGAAREKTREAQASAAASEAGAAAARASEESEREVGAAREQTREAQASAAASEASAAAARASEEHAREIGAAKEQTREAQASAAVSEAGAAAARESEENARAQLRELQAKQTERGLVLTLGNVLFDTANATLKPGAYLVLDRLARFMQSSPGTKIIVEGHADSRGSDEYNQELSHRRAQSVAEGLESRGVGADRIQPIGRGKRYPVASNETAEGRQENRRVEIVFSDAHGQFAQGAER